VMTWSVSAATSMWTSRRSRSGSPPPGGSSSASSAGRWRCVRVVDVQQTPDARRSGVRWAGGEDGGAGGGEQVGPALWSRRRRRRGRGRFRRGTRPGRCRGRTWRSERSSSTLLGPLEGMAFAGCAARSRTPCVELHVAAGGQERELRLARRARRRDGCRRAGPGSGGRSGTRAVRADEVEHGAGALARVLRRPRPSCWRNSVGLSVGRSMSTVSTSGTSTPSLNRSTENTTFTVPAARSRSAASRSARGLSPHTPRRRCRGG
jgi:hypothetical protein